MISVSGAGVNAEKIVQIRVKIELGCPLFFVCVSVCHIASSSQHYILHTTQVNIVNQFAREMNGNVADMCGHTHE